jgi:hypothetical protein
MVQSHVTNLTVKLLRGPGRSNRMLNSLRSCVATQRTIAHA